MYYQSIILYPHFHPLNSSENAVHLSMEKYDVVDYKVSMYIGIFTKHIYYILSSSKFNYV